jgi:rare lipoprotein A
MWWLGPMSPTKGSILAGRHAAVPHPDSTRGPLRRLLPAFAGTLVALILIGGAVLTVHLQGPSGNRADRAPADTAVDDIASGTDRSGDRADRADRGEMQEAPSPSPTPSATDSPAPSPSPSPSRSSSVKRSPSTPATTGTVASSGTCKASYYDTGTTTANGERFDPNGLTAAHKTLPFNTRVRVTNNANGKSVVVRINDRGPFIEGRCLDLARGAFTTIASIGSGVITAKYEVLA